MSAEIDCAEACIRRAKLNAAENAEEPGWKINPGDPRERWLVRQPEVPQILVSLIVDREGCSGEGRRRIFERSF